MQVAAAQQKHTMDVNDLPPPKRRRSSCDEAPPLSRQSSFFVIMENQPLAKHILDFVPVAGVDILGTSSHLGRSKEYVSALLEANDEATSDYARPPIVPRIISRINPHLFGDRNIWSLALKSAWCGDDGYAEVWRRTPHTFTEDLEFVVEICRDFLFKAYEHIPRETRRSRRFVEMLESQLKSAFGENNDPDTSLTDMKWPTWITDQKSVETYLTTRTGDWECIPDKFVCIALEHPENQSWCTFEWASRMCCIVPPLAMHVISCSCAEREEEDKALLRIKSVREIMNISVMDAGTRTRLWKTLVHIVPFDVLSELKKSDVKPEEEDFLISVFENYPKLYCKAAKHIQYRREVAKTAFCRSGMQIKDSIWNDDKELALLAVKQNGLALKYVSDRLCNDKEVQKAAVQQNGLALAHVPYGGPFGGHYYSDIVRTAVRQNIAAAVFNEQNYFTEFYLHKQARGVA